MSTTPTFASTYGQILVHTIPEQTAPQLVRSSGVALRRRPTMCQGQALEKLGRAIEYLYDSQVYQNSGDLTASDIEAVQILMRLSREVFVECREVVPARRGLKLWLHKLWPLRSAA
jgi:hypothetical protein